MPSNLGFVGMAGEEGSRLDGRSVRMGSVRDPWRQCAFVAAPVSQHYGEYLFTRGVPT